MSARTPAALLLVGLVALAGCAGPLASGGVPTHDEAVEGYEDLSSVGGTVEYRFDGVPSENMTVRVEQVPGERKLRQRVLAPPERAGDRIVSNGSVAWLYNATEDEVTRISLPDRSEANETTTRDLVATVFANLSSVRENRTVSVSALPVVPAGGDPGAPATVSLWDTNRINVTYRGTATVADRRTHVVRLVPVTSGDPDFGGVLDRTTYWFDAEYFYPIKATAVLTVDGNVTRTERTYRNVTFNEGVEDEAFEFDPPANATVTRRDRPRTFASAEAAERHVSFPVPEPEAPREFTLSTARVTDGDERTTVTLQYTNGTHEFTVRKRQPPEEGPNEGDRRTLGGTDVTVSSYGEVTVIRWTCGDAGYVVSGTVPARDLRAVASDLAAEC